MVCQNKLSRHKTFSCARGSTNIDITLSNRQLESSIHEWAVVPDITSSDHRILRYSLTLTMLAFTRKPPRFATERADWALFNNTLSQKFLQQGNIKESPPEVHADLLSGILYSAAGSAIPVLRSRRKITPPWWSDELLEARRKLKCDARALRQENCPARRATYNNSQNRYTKILRTEKRNSWRAFCTQEGTKTWGKLYRWLRSTKTQPAAPTSLVKPDGSRNRSLDETTEYMLNCLIPSEQTQVPPPRPQTQENNNHDPYSKEELYEELGRMAPNKAPGTDRLTVKMVKNAKQIISTEMVNLVDKCLTNAYFPSIWKQADVVAILKGPGKDPSSPKSYRPISLLPVLGKIVEKAINRRLLKETENNRSGRTIRFYGTQVHGGRHCKPNRVE